MSKQKKDGRSLNCVIARSVFEQLEAYCEEVGQSKTTAVERILKQYLSEYAVKTQKNNREVL